MVTLNSGDRVTWDKASHPGLHWTEGVVISTSPYGVQVMYGPDNDLVFFPKNRLDTLKRVGPEPEVPGSD